MVYAVVFFVPKLSSSVGDVGRGGQRVKVGTLKSIASFTADVSRVRQKRFLLNKTLTEVTSPLVPIPYAKHQKRIKLDC